MRNEAMEPLDVLVGSWHTTMRNAWFLQPADQEVAGSATVEWLGDAFVVFRWTMAGGVGKAATGSRVQVVEGWLDRIRRRNGVRTGAGSMSRWSCLDMAEILGLADASP